MVGVGQGQSRQWSWESRTLCSSSTLIYKYISIPNILLRVKIGCTLSFHAFYKDMKRRGEHSCLLGLILYRRHSTMLSLGKLGFILCSQYNHRAPTLLYHNTRTTNSLGTTITPNLLTTFQVVVTHS